ncbi:acyl-CoA dehydrogenase family protein [Pseudonocardia nigra]|uniref:acyl-CoA dehydrogenase family protein n=1 Tax=Pseudonocardia nigra TaxID=1921578 RepID=UPI001C5DD351|nr:acyl-CoA dehydrogenase family protein [Pseudonocardia nigra]
MTADRSDTTWGGQPFWGLGHEWDPDRLLTPREKALRATLIGRCEQEMRANAERSDDELRFARRNLELLGGHGLTTSPDFTGYDDLSMFVVDAADVTAAPSLWDALGLHGNQSGAVEVAGAVVPAEKLVGPIGDGAESNDEVVDPWFLTGSSAVWNGIAMGAIDIAKRHTTGKEHRDAGKRVADYPAVQDYVGAALIDTNASRLGVFSVAGALDGATEHNRRVLQPGTTARAEFLRWCWWNQKVDDRSIDNETANLDPAGKRALAEKLLAQADEAERLPHVRKVATA